MAGEFLGRGWAFPPSVDCKGRVRTVESEEDISQAILLILSTAKGERVMRPDFGCGIHDFAFEVVNASAIALMESSVREALARWEPRIDLTSVSMDKSKLAEGLLTIRVEYSIRATNNQFNLVYPFYLSEGR